MNRSGKIVLFSHCLLNPNSKIKGTARPWSEGLPLLQYLLSQDIGIYQLPCPEQTFSGSNRWGQSKEQYNNPFFRNHCHRILNRVIKELQSYQEAGYSLAGFLGIKGSPSCGVKHTFSADWGGELSSIEKHGSEKHGSLVKEPGVFVEIFSMLLQDISINIPFIEVDEEDSSATIDLLRQINGFS